MAARKLTREVKEQLALVETWKEIPVGTPVIVTKDLGEQVHTRTRSGPWMLGADSRDLDDPTHCPGHTAVIQVEGITGCYSLDRVRRDVEAKDAVPEKKQA